MTFEEKVNSVIGKEYDSTRFHCWDLVMYLVPNAPSIKASHQSLLKTVSTFKYEIAKHSEYELVDDIKDGDIVLLRSLNSDVWHHAGVFYQNGVIHADQNKGTVYESLRMINTMYKIKGVRI